MKVAWRALAVGVAGILMTGALGVAGTGQPAGASNAKEKASSVSASASAVSCGSLQLQNPTTYGLAVPSGSNISTTATLDGISATLSGLAVEAPSPYSQPAVSNATLNVLDKERRVLSVAAPIPPSTSGTPAPFIPTGIGPAKVPYWSNFTAQSSDLGVPQPICVAHFDGTHPETVVLVGAYTGGMHCCGYVYAYPVTAHGVSSTPVERYLGNDAASVVQSGKSAVIATSDNAFNYEFASYAGSGTPVSAFEVERFKFVNTTEEHQNWITEDAAHWWSLWQSSAPGLGLGVLAAWVADECNLGKGTTAFDTLNQLDAQGLLTSELGGWPSGSQYIKQLRAFLTSHGYPAASHSTPTTSTT